jgi:hypothetical protein
MNMFVSTAAIAATVPAVASATTLPQHPATPALLYDPQKVSPELCDLMSALNDVDDVLKAKAATYDAAQEQYRAWSNLSPEPRKYGSRTYRKWSNRQEKFTTKIGYYEAQEDWRDAADDQQKARRRVAEFRSRDLNDVAMKAAAAIVFEADGKGYRRDYLLAQGVTIDIAYLQMPPRN